VCCACGTSAALWARCPAPKSSPPRPACGCWRQPADPADAEVGFDFVTFTSGTALALSRLAKGQRRQGGAVAGKAGEGLGRHLALSLEDLKMLEQRLAEASEEERAAITGLSGLAC